MTKEDLKKVEDIIYSNVVTMIGNDIPTENEFYDFANKVRQALPILLSKISDISSISDIEFENICNSIREKITVKMSGVDAIIEGDEDHESWLDKRRSETDWFFWSRYAKYLQLDKKWSSMLIASLDTTSDKILDLLGDPASEKNFSRRGLIIGDVQSGKTANYTAICNKAADVGYNVIIVLTGMLEDLRQQTQERLDLEFAGKKSQVFSFNVKEELKKYQPMGVAKYGSRNRVSQLTSTKKDFNKNIFLSQKLDIRDFNGTILFVVKKNKSILENLIDWLKNSIDIGKNQIERSLLLIDDEADNASINTSKIDEDPTAINRCIRNILSKFCKTTYIGITATPFANIFINPESTEEMLGDDLFPKDFIYALDVPENYIGPSAIFGDDGKYKDMLIEIEPENHPDVENFIPKKHKKDFKVDELPPSLYEAMNYFLLVNAVLDLRGYENTHRTMLIHISRFVNAHKQIYNLVNEWRYRLVSDLRNYSALSAEKAEQNSEYISSLHRIFDKYDFGNISGLSWGNFFNRYVRKAIEPVKIGIRNSSSKNSFNYNECSSEGLRIIAIGGNSFSRGLTLEGLCVTYFYRHSKTYDTLMQMGRWFGYRPHYDNLCKIWTTSEIIDWYGYINDVSSELREEIFIMQEYGMTPKDFGLKVRQHPDTLMITAKNKMRSSVPIKRPVGLDKIFLETPRLLNDEKILSENKDLVIDFIKFLNGFPPIYNLKNKNAWSGVPKEKIAEFILKFQTSQWHLAFQNQPIAEYIRQKMDDKLWDVIIAEGSSQIQIQISSSPIVLKPIVRKILAKDEQIMISGTKVRVGSLGITRLGLTDAEIKKAEQEFHSIKGNEKKNLPDRAYMIYGRNPLLVLYIIEPKNKIANVPDVLFAIGVGFPARSPNVKESNIETADYVANVVASEKFNFQDFDDNDDEDIEE